MPSPAQRARRIFTLLSAYSHNSYDEQNLPPDLMAIVHLARQELGDAPEDDRELARLSAFAAVNTVFDSRDPGEAFEAASDLSQIVSHALGQ
jgi:hypothetical protein